MPSKTIAVPEEAYQYLKARADEAGLPVGRVVLQLVKEQRKGGGVPRGATEADQVSDPTRLQVGEIDQGMGYERKPEEVTARDGLAALYAISRGNNNDMGTDRS
jgi:hypothetical protein